MQVIARVIPCQGCYFQRFAILITHGVTGRRPLKIREFWAFQVRKCIQEGRKKTGGEDILCNDYFSTMRAATDKRSSPIGRVDQVAKGWSLKQRLWPLQSRNNFYENPLVSGYCQFLDNSLKWFFALKNYPLKNLNIPARTHRQALEIRFFVCP